MEYIEIEEQYFGKWVDLWCKLWPYYSEKREELEEIFIWILESFKETAFLCILDGEAIGFINVSLRSDYVEGCISSPIWYVEWIFVLDEYRHQKIALHLIERAGEWLKERGCTQIWSDTTIDNTISQEFHTKIWFKEVSRIVHFIKDLDS